MKTLQSILHVSSKRPLSFKAQHLTPARSFATTPRSQIQNRNRIYDNIRYTKEFDDLLLLSTSSRSPLITLWTASWCQSCKTVTPIIRNLIENQGAGEDKGGVFFAEVEFDSPTIQQLAGRYAITGIPTLMAFSRGEPQMKTRLTDVGEMKDEELLRLWITHEALTGLGSEGPGWFGSMFKVR